MQYMASGFAWTQARQRFEYHGLIGFGVVIAGLTGAGGHAGGQTLPDQRLRLLPLPPRSEEFELATADGL